MKLKKNEYFNLLEDEFIYKAHKEEIDAFIKEDLEIREKHKAEIEKLNEKHGYAFEEMISEEIDRLYRPHKLNREIFLSPQEIDIPDNEYEELIQHSKYLYIYEGSPLLCLVTPFESYRKKYEKEKLKCDKLKNIIERLMKMEDCENKVDVLLDVFLGEK